MESVRPLWRFPVKERYKVNVHSFIAEQLLSNDNVSGVGVVLRNHNGQMHTMMAETLGIPDQRINELYALFEGMNCAFMNEKCHFDLESDHNEAFLEWRHAGQHDVVQPHRHVVQQLTQRRLDPRIHVVVDNIFVEL